jgi:SAM-dependent methyltransferase
MNRFTDRDHLRNVQYRDSSNLQSRISVHQAYSANPLPWHEWVFSQMDLKEGASVLDLGCGPGDLWVDNRVMIPNTWSLFISDLSFGMVREAIHRIRDRRVPGGLVVDAAAIPFSNAEFDAVVANHMLFHIDPASDALKEINRVLRPGGTLYATTVGRDHLLELREAIIHARGEAIDPDEEASARATLGFTLETGPPKARYYFHAVDVNIHEDWLEVPEVAPLIEYVMSSSVWDLEEEEIQRLSAYIAAEIEASGAMRIRKHQGIVIARKRK